MVERMEGRCFEHNEGGKEFNHFAQLEGGRVGT